MLELRPNFDIARHRRAELLAKEGALGKAREDYVQLGETPEVQEHLRVLAMAEQHIVNGQTYQQAGDFHVARDSYSQALEVSAFGWNAFFSFVTSLAGSICLLHQSFSGTSCLPNLVLPVFSPRCPLSCLIATSPVGPPFAGDVSWVTVGLTQNYVPCRRRRIRLTCDFAAPSVSCSSVRPGRPLATSCKI